MTNYLHSLLIWATGLCGLSITASAADVDTKFIDLLEYEVQNRAFALASTSRMADRQEVSELAGFWQAYEQLEVFNQWRYQAFTKKYGIDQKATWFTHTRIYFAGLATAIAPKSSMNIMQKAAVKYLAKLQLLLDAAPETDKNFFRYVLAQEQAQVEALALAVENKPELAEQVLRDFLVGQKKPNI